MIKYYATLSCLMYSELCIIVLWFACIICGWILFCKLNSAFDLLCFSKKYCEIGKRKTKTKNHFHITVSATVCDSIFRTFLSETHFFLKWHWVHWNPMPLSKLNNNFVCLMLMLMHSTTFMRHSFRFHEKCSQAVTQQLHLKQQLR